MKYVCIKEVVTLIKNNFYVCAFPKINSEKVNCWLVLNKHIEFINVLISIKYS